jgi:hypothetical protein
MNMFGVPRYTVNISPSLDLARPRISTPLNPSSQVSQSFIFNTLKGRLGDQRGGSEWETIKILLEGD